ncbi:MHC class II regulatory factor RFX1 isoform X2 [Xenopus laevis]|uniref:MHC class II regulatory factor RFX1 isoform X2 n=1 Tax=Xenopus laevis TaxID=8355 RepID=A0A8J0ULH8_XENLA|nr:MHC class II regulatory factor RFX1 isoform X2 [Xenopus laevis]
MATQAYVTELQAAPPAPTQGTSQQYVAELQVTQQTTPGSSQSAGSQTPTAQQYIVVTVSEGSVRGSDGELSPEGTPTPTAAVATQVVQQVQAAQQRLLLEARVQPKITAVSPLQLTGSSLPQQRLVVQSSPQGTKAAQVSLTVHTVQQPALSPSDRSVVQANPQKSSPVHQLTVQALQHVQGTPEVQQLQQVPVQHVYPSQVQYVEGTDTTYTGGTIRSGSYSYTETPLYNQATGSTYYESQGATGQVSSPTSSPALASSPSLPMYVSGGQILTNTTQSAASGGTGAGASGSGTYVIQGGFIMGSSTQSYSHTTRASPATVQWLLDNYETAEGVSLPRSTLYCHYLLHCQEQKLEPVNAASFGKLIRSVFMGLRTRRLGTRGNSKYHYYGLRIKASSSLMRLMEDQQHLAMRQQPFSQKQRLKAVQKMEGMSNGVGGSQQQTPGLSDISSQVQQYQQFLDGSKTLPEFAEIDLQGKPLPDDITLANVKAFQLLYREHCEAIVDVVVNLQFTLVETLWKTFWRFNQAQHSDNAIDDEAEKRLPKDCLVLLSKYEPLLKWSRDCDHLLYQVLVETLIPDVLRPIPSALTQAIRNFAKSLESWLTSAMMNIPEEMVRIKAGAASAFAQTLRRYTSLNHLAQAARAVLQNTAQINQMLSDLNRVDFTNVQEQASWVCRCADRVVQRLEQDFKLTLQQQSSLEQWAEWLDSVVSQVLKPYQGSPGFPKAAKLFLLKWSFYSSMVIRDLTLRSAASFGSFHLIRLLYDEYMYYLIEHRVAQARGETPIAVMGEFATPGNTLRSLDQEKEEEEEEDDESDEDLAHELPLTMNDPSNTLGCDSLEPPAKLARSDSQGIFVQVPPTS